MYQNTATVKMVAERTQRVTIRLVSFRTGGSFRYAKSFFWDAAESFVCLQRQQGFHVKQIDNVMAQASLRLGVPLLYSVKVYGLKFHFQVLMYKENGTIMLYTHVKYETKRKLAPWLFLPYWEGNQSDYWRIT